METFAYISCVVLGAALGIGGDWLFWQFRFREAGDRVREENKAIGQKFNAQIEEKEELLNSVNADLAAAREEVAVLKNSLEDETQKLKESLALNDKLTVLEEELAGQRAEVERLQTEKAELVAVVEDMKEKMAEDRKAFDDGLVYVQGSHYLPASVVRNLTSKPEAGDEDEEDV